MDIVITDAAEDSSTLQSNEMATNRAWLLLVNKSTLFRYELGIEDSGHPKGLTEEQLDATLAALSEVAARIPAQFTTVDRIQLSSGLWVAEVFIQADMPNQEGKEIRVALFGPSGVGKTTLMAVLSKGERDNGQGSARLSLLHHRHELLSGRTSTVAVASLALDQTGQVIPVCENEFGDPPSLVDQQRWLGAPYHLHLFDLAGADRYCRTALCSLASPAGPQLVLLLNPAEEWRRKLLEALDIPYLSVQSKGDLQENANHTEGSIRVSAVTGEGIPELLSTLHQKCIAQQRTTQPGNAFLIERVSQSDEDLTILHGVVLAGQIHQGHQYWLGDQRITVNSIQRNRLSVPSAQAPQMVSISTVGEGFTKGMILSDQQVAPTQRIDTSLQFIYQLHSPDLKGHRYPLQGTVFLGGGKAKASLWENGVIELEEPIRFRVTKCIFLGDNGFLYAGIIKDSLL